MAAYVSCVFLPRLVCPFIIQSPVLGRYHPPAGGVITVQDVPTRKSGIQWIRRIVVAEDVPSSRRLREPHGVSPATVLWARTKPVLVVPSTREGKEGDMSTEVFLHSFTCH